MDPDQLAYQKPADLDHHCFQNRYIPDKYSKKCTIFGLNKKCHLKKIIVSAGEP